ncbi:DNA primase [Methanobacterium oryzae]|uniref:DNA primase n=1 Tax=Methanobacterium oryzae TaxID=69540 RepID=UPI003D21C181
MIPMSFINPLSDEGKQIVRKEGLDLERIFDENDEIINSVYSTNAQETSDDDYIPKNYADIVIKRVEWYVERKSDPEYKHKKYAFLFHPQISKFDVIAFYILCQAIGVKFGPNSRESRAISELQGHLIENRLEELLKSERVDITRRIMNNLIVQDKIKWMQLADLISSKKINMQDLVLKDGNIILDLEDFIEYFGDKIKHRQPEKMYNLFIGNRVKELIIIKMIMQNTENYIKSVHERSNIVEPNPILLKIAEKVSEVLSKEIRYYGRGSGGGDVKASPLNVELFPPCIKLALEGIKSGGRNEVIVLFLTPFLSYARLYPSVFRGNTTLKVSDIDADLNITKNEILPMIHDAADRCSPPLFDDQPQEKVNINAKLGFGMHDELSLQHEGETTWYTPMSCEKVKMNMPSLCKPDKTCKSIGNPLSYYTRKVWQNKSE